MEPEKKDITKKPENVEEFIQWVKDKFDIDINSHISFNFVQNVKALYKDVEQCQFWRNIEINYSTFNDSYKIGKNLDLFVRPNEIPIFVTKDYESFLLKVYRKNVLENDKWPEAPKDGWILPKNWFERIKDIVRTRVVVKYLDGVDDLIKKIEDEAKSNNCIPYVDYEARDEGYYAAHINIEFPTKITSITGKPQDINFCFEIQITTQLQEVLSLLLHKYYEERRKRTEKPNIKWQWNYKSEEFAPNYLGHILHYVEGMIMEIREKQMSK